MRHTRYLLMAVLSFLAALPASAQHLGSRQQWQPQTENDARLQQPVQLETIGRAAITGLPLLSEKTGVSLGVAPEDLATVGERKFTVIAKGCSLKAIMVQLEEALQECHWDVEATGKEPVYLLHRNAGVDEAAAARAEDMVAARQATRRRALAERVEAAKAALAMSPKELKQLEQSDLFLARGMQHPAMRAATEALLSLPDERLSDFLAKTVISFTYAQANPRFRRATALVVERLLRQAEEWAEAESEGEQGPTETEVSGWRKASRRELPPDTRLTFDATMRGEILMSISVPAQFGIRELEGGWWVLLSRYPTHPKSWSALRLLTDTGDTEVRAAATDAAWWQRGNEEREAEQTRRSRSQHGALPPELEQLIPAQIGEAPSLPGFQHQVAAATGLSVISDWFSNEPIYSDSALPPDPLPLFQTLDRLAAMLGFAWQVNGRCLTFHRTYWYYFAQEEAPESLLEFYREKLRAAGRFTFEDVVAFAAQAHSLRPRALTFSLPLDLRETGLGSLVPRRGGSWCMPLVTYLTPELRAKAESEHGLAFSGMSHRQQQEVRRLARARLGEEGDTRAESASLRIRQRERIADRHYYTTYTIELDLPGDPRETLTSEFHLRGAEAPPEALPPSE